MTKILALILALLMLAACGNGTATPSSDTPSSSPAASGSPGGEETAAPVKTSYVLGTADAVDGGFDRTGAAGDASNFNALSVWDNLFVIDPVSNEIEGQMVDTWEWIDNTTLKMTLYDNIYSEAGYQITGEDVLYCMERFILTNSRMMSYYVAYNFEESFVDPADPLTFTLVYNYEYGPGLSYLTDCPVTSKQWIESAEDTEWFTNPDVTGPYKVLEHVADSHVKYELRDTYYKDTTGMPQEVTVKFYAEQSTMYIDYCNGVIDAAFGLTSSDYTRLLGGEEPDSVFGVAPNQDVYMIILPEYVEAFADIRVRQAIAHAIDVSSVMAASFGALGFEAVSTLPAGVNYSIDAGYPYEYNPELSKQLLAEAGYPDGLSIRFVGTNQTVNVNIVEAIQAYLAAVGIDMSVETYAMPTAIPMMINGETDFIIKNAMEGSPQLEPDKIWDTLGENSTFLCAKNSDPEFNEYVMGGLNNVDPAVRADYYAKAQNWMYENYWHMPICETGIGYVYRDDIASFNFLSPSSPDIRGIKVS